jgi:hypothetical protein
MAKRHFHNGKGHNASNPTSHPAAAKHTEQGGSPLLVHPLHGEDLPLPDASIPISKTGFSIYLQVWNALVAIDRQVGTLNNMKLRPVLDRAILAVVEDEGAKWLPFAEAVVREYQERRVKARNPLRFKDVNRLRMTIPMIGPLANLGLQDNQDRRLLRRKDGSIVAARPWSEEL